MPQINLGPYRRVRSPLLNARTIEKNKERSKFKEERGQIYIVDADLMDLSYTMIIIVLLMFG